LFDIHSVAQFAIHTLKQTKCYIRKSYIKYLHHLCYPVSMNTISGRLCVCGVPIPESHVLCHACQEIYTLRRELWPEWLHDWMDNYQAEIEYERSGPESLDEIMSRQSRVDNG